MKISHTIKLFLLSLLLIAPLSAVAAENAGSLVDRISQKMKSMKSAEVVFTISSHQGHENGRMTLGGNAFVIETPSLSTWYDGTTQWSYAKSQREVTITNPTNAEISEVNPLLILNSIKQHYTPTLLKGSKTAKVIKLTARQKNSPIATAVLTVNSSSLYPQSILLTLSNRQTISIKISSIKSGNALPRSKFQFNKRLYPGVEIIDLR